MTDYKEENRQLAEKVSEFQRMAAKKNSEIGYSLENVTIQLLQYEGSLKRATREDLLKLTHNKRVVDFLLRIFDYKPLEDILKDVKLTKSGRIRLTSDLQKRIEIRQAEETASEGAYENGVKALEERSY